MFSAVCVTVSATGHELASGAVVPWWALCAGWAGLMCVVAPLAGRERALPGIATTLLTGELALHLVFCAGQLGMPAPSTGAVRTMLPIGRRLCGGGADPLIRSHAGGAPGAALPPGMSGMAGGAPHAMTMSSMFTPGMLAAHLVAAFVSGLLLRHGEATLWRIVRLSQLLAKPLRAVLPPVRLLTAVRTLALAVAALSERLTRTGRHRLRAPYRPRLKTLLHCVVRRGPPAGLLTA